MSNEKQADLDRLHSPYKYTQQTVLYGVQITQVFIYIVISCNLMNVNMYCHIMHH